MAGASHKCQICHDTLLKGYNLPTGHIALLEIDGNIITSHVATAIKEASYHREFIEYITQRAGWQDKCSRAGKQLSSGQCLTIFKLEFALFATMSQHHQMETGYWPQMSKMSTLPGNSGACIPMPKGLIDLQRCIDKGTSFYTQKTYMPICHWHAEVRGFPVVHQWTGSMARHISRPHRWHWSVDIPSILGTTDRKSVV